MSEEIILQCGHSLAGYELTKTNGGVYIRYYCEKGHYTEWVFIGYAPEFPEDIPMEG